jgi:uncharacterized membrane protein YgdD (TMEM256/DUF423 family)
LTEDALFTFETTARYQMYHALALLAVAFAITRWLDSDLPLIAGWLFVAGTVLFSGSLYLLSLTDLRWLGAIAPSAVPPSSAVGNVWYQQHGKRR